MAVGTTAFPTALDTSVELVELTNNASSTLGAAVLVGATTITVDDPAEFPTTGFATLVDDLTTPTKIEIISWTGKSGSDLTGVTKGAQGTSDQAWSIGDNIEVRPTKGQHEALRGAIIAIQTKLGYGASTSTANTVLLGNGTGTSAWGAITNAYIDAAAAIAYSKLNLSGSILNADINASAAIAVSKLAALTASRLPVLDASGFLSASSVTSTEAGYLSGVTSAIQTQLNAKAAAGANTDLTSIYLNNTGLKVKDTNASHGLSIVPGSDLSADRVFTLTTGDADRTLTMAGDATISGTNTGDVTLAGTPDYITISGQVITRNAVDLAADVTGNLPVANLNSGTGASGSTFWRGDGTWAAPAGSGDVTGPASATDNAIARYDLTTGKLLQDSVVTIADTSGNMAGVGTLNTHTIPGGTDTFALLAASQTFTNKTLTTPIIASISNSGTITIPTGTDTLVGRATTDTLTNKTLTAPDINGGTADALTSLGIRSTGTGAFDLTFANTENLIAGRILTFTVNDAARTINLGGDLTLAGAFITSGANSLTLTTSGATNVTLPTSGTLVNSAVTALSSLVTVGTITTGGLGTGAVIGGVTMTLGTDGTGDVYYRSAGGVLTRLAAGTNGHVLTLAAGLPSWAAPTGGGGLTVGTSAIASGVVGRMLYEAAGNVLGEAAGITYQTGASPTVTITGQNASYIPLRIITAATPSASVLSLSNNGTEKIAFTSSFYQQFYSVGTGQNTFELFEGATSATQSRFYIQRGTIGMYETIATILNTFSRNVKLASSNNYFQIDGTSSNPAELYYRTAAGTAADTVLKLMANFATTPSNGYGVSLSFYAKTTTADQEAAKISAIWTDITNATRTSKLQFNLVNNASALTPMVEFLTPVAAGKTSLWIYDFDNGTLENVVVGAPDSGGTGIKVLGIAN